METNIVIKALTDAEKMYKILNSPKRIDPNDRLWIQMTPAYCPELGYPYLSKDVIQLEKDVSYLFSLDILSVTSDKQMYVCFQLPQMKGKLESEYTVRDIDGSQVKGPFTEFCFPVKPQINHIEFTCSTKTGGLMVHYELDDQDAFPKHQTSTVMPHLRMICTKNRSGNYIYACSDNSELICNKLIFEVNYQKI